MDEGLGYNWVQKSTSIFWSAGQKQGILHKNLGKLYGYNLYQFSYRESATVWGLMVQEGLDTRYEPDIKLAEYPTKARLWIMGKPLTIPDIIQNVWFVIRY